MQTALGGPSSRRTLSERLITRALSQLTLANATGARPLSTPSSRWTCPSCRQRLPVEARRRSSSSSEWKSRQSRDHYARKAKVMELKSRASFKLLEMDAKYKLFKPNQTVIDLGYAPGSWSQVAVERTKPNGIVVGIDLIPVQPPRGVTSIQGDFLSPQVRRLVRDVCYEQVRRRRREDRERRALERRFEGLMMMGEEREGGAGPRPVEDRPSYIDLEKMASHDIEAAEAEADKDGRMVDLVISDMLMNTSGMAFRDHARSMDLCYAALSFASDNLKHNGHFVCKFYQGAEDKLLQTKLQKMFQHVHREKPDASRQKSKEAYFVALTRNGSYTLAGIEGR